MHNILNEIHKYDDIIDLPHHVSTVHPQMSMMDRAAQFSSFAALSGHGEAIRKTEKEVENYLEFCDIILDKDENQP